jgi:hypothetical protein
VHAPAGAAGLPEVPATAHTADATAAAATVPDARASLMEALQHAAEHAAALAVGGALCLGSWGLMRGTVDAVLGPVFGPDATMGLLAAELGCGHLAGPRLMAGKRDAWTCAVCGFLAAAICCEVVLSFVREDVLHAQHMREAARVAGPLAPCTVQQPPHEDMPPDIASSGDGRAMRTWQAGKAQRDKDWYAAQREQCQQDAARQAAQQQSQADRMVRAADEHSPLEPYLFALLALVMSGTTAAAAASFGPLVGSLLSICRAVAGLFRRRKLEEAAGLGTGKGVRS